MEFPPIRKAVQIELFLLMALCLLFGWRRLQDAASKGAAVSQDALSYGQAFRTEAASATRNDLFEETENGRDDFIKWIDFNVTCEALTDASRYDIETHASSVELDWIELLAVLAAKNGGDFSRYRSADMKAVAEALLSGEETIESLSEGLAHYGYYYEAYQAVLGGMLGEYQIQVKPSQEAQEGDGALLWLCQAPSGA